MRYKSELRQGNLDTGCIITKIYCIPGGSRAKGRTVIEAGLVRTVVSNFVEKDQDTQEVTWMTGVYESNYSFNSDAKPIRSFGLYVVDLKKGMVNVEKVRYVEVKIGERESDDETENENQKSEKGKLE